MNDELLTSIRILAVSSVENPDWEVLYRKICRWYSREFSTPLKEVQSMSEYDVLLTYFEDKYQEMASSPIEDIKNNYEKIKISLVTGEREIIEQEKQEEMEDEAWAQQMADELKKELEKNQQKQAPTSNEPNLIDIEDKFELQGETDF